MKVYKCDSCEKVIENPYKENMKEFFYSLDFEYLMFRERSKREKTIHLCEDCFKGLHLIAEKKRSNNNEWKEKNSSI